MLVSELRGLPSLPVVELDQRLERLHTTGTPNWSRAQRREAVIREALQGYGPTTALVGAAAKTLGLSTRTVRRLITRYTASAQTTSLVAHLRGPKKSHRRLGTEREQLIDAAIDKHYLIRPRTPMEEVYKEVVRRCRDTSLVPPARNSVLKRIRALDARLVARRRLGAKSAEAIALSTPGMLDAIDALELVQIDHTLADVMIVDSEYRRSIGRPWLSLAVDVATRSVLGSIWDSKPPPRSRWPCASSTACYPRFVRLRLRSRTRAGICSACRGRSLSTMAPNSTARRSHVDAPNTGSSWRTGRLPDPDSVPTSSGSSAR